MKFIFTNHILFYITSPGLNQVSIDFLKAPANILSIVEEDYFFFTYRASEGSEGEKEDEVLFD